MLTTSFFSISIFAFCIISLPLVGDDSSSHNKLETEFSLDEQVLQEVFDRSHKLSEIDPAWKTQISDTYENGTVHTLVFIDIHGNHVKCIEYYPTGERKNETDCIQAGIAHGASISFYENGVISQIVSYVNGKKEGLLQQFYPDGNLYFSATFSNNLLHGPAKIFCQGGTLIQKMHMHHGQLHGFVVHYFPTGAVCRKVHFQNGLLHGPCEEYYENGSPRSKKHYTLGYNTTKEMKIFSENGTVLEQGHYILGKQHGCFTSFFPSGAKKRTATYIHGKLDGKEMLFSEQGQCVAVNTYTSGIPVGENIQFDNTGTVISLHQDDKIVCNKRNFQGDVVATYTLQNHLLDGEYREFGPNKNTLKALFYKNGKLHGEQKIFYESGQPHVVAVFCNGEKQGSYIEYTAQGDISLHYEWDHDLPHGLCTQLYRPGKPKEISHYTQGIRDGKTQFFAPNGTIIYECNFVKGHEDGLMTERHENGQIAFQASYKDGQLEGDVSSFYEDGSRKEQKFFSKGIAVGKHTTFYSKENNNYVKSIIPFNKNGRIDGQAIYYFPNKQIMFTAEYQDGQFHGKKRGFSENGEIIFDACYIHGQLNGPFFQKKSSGMEVKANYKNNQLSGAYQEVYITQEGKKVQILEATFLDGQMDGTCTKYNEQGQKIIEHHFVAGKREGISRMFHEQGAIMVEATFKDGKQHGMMTEYFPNGKLFRTQLFHEGLQDGEEIIYYDTGSVAKKCFYKAGKLHGLMQEWNPEQILIFEAEFKNGLRHGKFNKYDATGKLKVRQTFSEDVLQSKGNR